MPSLDLIRTVLLVEVLLMLGMILFTIVIFQRREARDARRAMRKRTLHELLQAALASDKAMDFSGMPGFFRDYRVLVPVLEELDRVEASPRMEALKVRVYERVLGDMARKFAASRIATRRNWAARMLSLHCEQADELPILKLIDDPIPLVRIRGVYCAMRLNTSLAIRAVLERVGKEARFARTQYMDGLAEHPREARPVVEALLQEDAAPHVRLVCYELLPKIGAQVPITSMDADLHAQDLELRLSATRALGAITGPDAEARLSRLLEDPQWEIRAVAAKMLGERRAWFQVQALSKRVCDQNWWVRINSASSLARLGGEGRAELERHREGKDSFARDAAVYALTLPEAAR